MPLCTLKYFLIVDAQLKAEIAVTAASLREQQQSQDHMRLPPNMCPGLVQL